MTATTPSEISFTPAESKLMTITCKYMRSMPDVDWKAVAEEYGYRDAKVARDKFGQFRSRISRLLGGSTTLAANRNTNGEGSAADDEGTVPKASAKSNGTKRKADAGTDKGDAEGGPKKCGRPATKPKAAKAALKEVSKTESMSEEEKGGGNAQEVVDEDET
ncbi:hypothetical protein MMC25_000831 [Agyrium rufum]|nr:hypothetical protein [Agyrium rufum]